MKWQKEPTTLGFYWMRWRRKHMRIWFHDIVWTGGDPWRISRQVRVPNADWHPAANFPHATFAGPLKPPKSIDPRHKRR